MWLTFPDFGKSDRHNLMRWLSTVNCGLHHQIITADLLPDSGEWLFLKPEYVRWEQQKPSSLLWLHGIPGSGKSKLVSRVIQELKEAPKAQVESATLAFFYCSRNTGSDATESKRSDPTEIMNCILKQISTSLPNVSHSSYFVSLQCLWPLNV